MIGKIIGAIVGAAAAGPWGFFGGAIIGHIVGDMPRRKKVPSSSSKSYRNSQFDTSNRLFIEFLCQGAAKVAKAKGHISQEDIHVIERIFGEMNFTAEMRQRGISHFRTAKDGSYTLEEVARNFMRHFQQRKARHLFFSVLIRIALSDNKLDPAEADRLRNVARILHIDPSVIDDIKNQSSDRNSYSKDDRGYKASRNSRSHSGFEKEYEILGLSANASIADVKKAYRAKCKELHPDILRSKGIGDIAMKVIEDELRRVNEAYDKIMKYRG